MWFEAILVGTPALHLVILASVSVRLFVHFRVDHRYTTDLRIR